MSSSRPAVAETVAELRELVAGLPGPVALVPTMGALHEGHRTLVRAARERAGSVVVSVFVNPTQFGPGEDFDRYPRTWDADLAALAEEGADVVLHPPVDEVHPPGAVGVTVHPGPLGDVLEGAVRPGHFTGVLTVVAKLFGLVRPDLAVFGEKDYQQLTLIRAMARELALGVEVVGVPTVREDDGMALSSRNRYLSPEQRATAATLSRALRAGADAGPRGAELDVCMAYLDHTVHRPTVDADRHRDAFAELADAGVTWIAVEAPWAPPDEVLRFVDDFGQTYLRA